MKDYVSSEARAVGQLRRRIEELSPWFHNLHLCGIDSAPKHLLSDYPAVKWSKIENALPAEPHSEVASDYDFWEEEIFLQPTYLRMHFMENSFSGNHTNWSIANTSGAEAMLRSGGLIIVAHSESETWLCVPTNVKRDGRYIQDLELSGELH